MRYPPAESLKKIFSSPHHIPSLSASREIARRGGLKRMAMPLAGHLARGEVAEFVIDQRQPVPRSARSAMPRLIE
jgi:hypothetical protein